MKKFIFAAVLPVLHIFGVIDASAAIPYFTDEAVRSVDRSTVQSEGKALLDELGRELPAYEKSAGNETVLLRRLELQAEELLIGRELGIARRLLLAAEDLHVRLAQDALHERAHRRLARAQQHLRDAGQRGARGLDVAGVGDEKCLVYRYDHGAV